MTILQVPIMLDDSTIAPFKAQSVQLTTQLAGHIALVEGGRLMDPATWVVRHIRTGVEIEQFRHFGPAPEIVDLGALRRFSEWMERIVDLDSSDPEEVFERLVATGIDVCDLVGYYTDKINDWSEPRACACGAANAHPADGSCAGCRRQGINVLAPLTDNDDQSWASSLENHWK